MKLLAVRLARSIWVVPRYFLNPQGVYTRPILEGIKTRYSFAKATLDAIAADEEIRFENGAFPKGGGSIAIFGMTLHASGIVVDTRSSTDDGDAFLEDLTTWVSKEYGMPSYADLPIKRLYASELNLSFDRPLQIFSSKLTPFLENANSVLGKEPAGKVGFIGFQVGPEQSLTDKPAPFRFEREINTPFAENRYYSFSPTTTPVHLKLIDLLEQAIA